MYILLQVPSKLNDSSFTVADIWGGEGGHTPCCSTKIKFATQGAIGFLFLAISLPFKVSGYSTVRRITTFFVTNMADLIDSCEGHFGQLGNSSLYLSAWCLIKVSDCVSRGFQISLSAEREAEPCLVLFQTEFFKWFKEIRKLNQLRSSTLNAKYVH